MYFVYKHIHIFVYKLLPYFCAIYNIMYCNTGHSIARYAETARENRSGVDCNRNYRIAESKREVYG